MAEQPKTIAGNDTFVIDPEDEEQEHAKSCCHVDETPSHWGQWLRPA